MDQELMIRFIVYLPIFLILSGMMFSVLIDTYISKRNRGILLIVIALLFILTIADYLESLFEISGTRIKGRTFAAFLGYSARPFILLMFIYLIGTPKKYWPSWILAIANFMIHLTAFFSDICFKIDDANHFKRGPLGFSCHIISGILLFYLLFLTLRKYRRVKNADTWIPIVNAILIIASVFMDSFADLSFFTISFLTISVTCSSLFYYIWLHLQFVRQHEDTLHAEQRIQIMMTQIQPHFLYNTIATVKALCRKDPEKAAEVADKFGAYLRQNLDSLGTVGRIPFEKELEHTKLYAEIEMIRFDHIRVEYDIEDDDFTVPPLVLQPMVENAIRHGVRIREEGIVRVTTRRQETYHEIVISDNGIGFDVKDLATGGNRHIGIQNVKERIETMCGGTLHVNSRTGTGTTVTIRIPISMEAAS